jgi:hypothetical protein
MAQEVRDLDGATEDRCSRGSAVHTSFADIVGSGDEGASPISSSGARTGSCTAESPRARFLPWARRGHLDAGTPIFAASRKAFLTASCWQPETAFGFP